MAQGNWAAQQSATNVSAVTYLEAQLTARGYVQGASNNEMGIVEDAINALLNVIPQSIAQAWTPTAVAATVAPEQTIAVTGSNGLTTDRVFVSYPPGTAPTAGVGILTARVSTAGVNATVSVQFVNPTAGSLTPPSGNYVFTFIRS